MALPERRDGKAGGMNQSMDLSGIDIKETGLSIILAALNREIPLDLACDLMDILHPQECQPGEWYLTQLGDA